MHRLISRAAIALASTLVLCGSAHAQLFRTYLSVNGNDSNPCTVGAPCRLLPAALNAVVDGGEVWMLDSANYNTSQVYVSKSVTILAVPGVVGSIVANGNGSTALVVSLAGAKVALRNLVVGVVATAPGSNGVVVLNASSVSIEDCLFQNLQGSAVQAIDGNATTTVRNTVFRNNGAGFEAQAGKASIVGSQFFGNTEGVLAHGLLGGNTATIGVTDSTISNSGYGVHAKGDNGSTNLKVMINHTTVENSGFALIAVTDGQGTAAIVASDSTIRNNSMAFTNNGDPNASIKSMGNNQISDNGADGSGLTTATLR
jgi:hypothetical protein